MANENLILTSRIPLIPLDYNEKEKAIEKEILVDYDNARIYIVSKQDKSIIFDVTQKILDSADKVSSDNITINIEGIGEVNLTQIINDLFLTQIGFANLGDVILVRYPEQYDLGSITKIDNRVGIVGFDVAADKCIPIKINNRIEWIPVEGNKIEPLVKDTNIVIDTTIPFYNVNLADYGTLEIRSSISAYCKVVLCCEGNIKTYAFSENVKKVESYFGIIHDVNARYIATFETFDFGQTWLADIKQYL